MKKIHILHIIDSLGVGGAEKLLVGVINNLSEYQHHVFYLTKPDTLKGSLPEGCETQNLNFSSKLDIFRCALHVRRYIKKRNIKIVHSHLVLATMIARLATPKHTKLFNSLHSMVGDRFFSKGKRLARFVEKCLYSKDHHIIAVSEGVLKDYDKIIGVKGKATVLPNFVSDEFFASEYKRAVFNNGLKIIAVGSLKKEKNYVFLLEAFRSLPGNFSLDIYGSGPQQSELERIITKYQVNVRLCGIRNNIHEVLREYDLYVMSSRVEGHPLALLEAMASGLPTLVSNIQAIQEVLGENGLYFNLTDPKEFVGSVHRIFNKAIDLDFYAKSNYEMARRNAGKDAYLKKLVAIYESR